MLIANNGSRFIADVYLPNDLRARARLEIISTPDNLLRFRIITHGLINRDVFINPDDIFDGKSTTAKVTLKHPQA